MNATLTLSDSFTALLIGIRSKCRCAELLLRAAGRNSDGFATSWAYRTAHRYISPDAPGDWLAYREKSGMVSFCPDGRTQEFNVDGKWMRKGRQDVKPAKLIRALLHPRLVKYIKPEAFGEFATYFKLAEDAATLSIVPSTFEEAYDDGNYRRHTHGGAMISSCMWGDPVGSFYRACGASVIVCKDGTGILRGRAILWPEVSLGARGIGGFMDRIYADCPEVTEFFCQWAASNGHYRKTRQSMDYKVEFTAPDQSEFECTARVEMKEYLRGAIPFFPFLDTFQWQDGSILINRETDEAEWRLNSTGGSREEINRHDGEVEDVDGNWIDEDDAVEVDGDYYERGDDRIRCCARDNTYYLASECYEVLLPSGRTLILHESHVSSCA